MAYVRAKQCIDQILCTANQTGLSDMTLLHVLRASGQKSSCVHDAGEDG